jgi:hypothetical protein
VLEIIVKKMGKRARLLCLQLCDLYGSPGSTLAVGNVASNPEADTPTATMLKALKSWRYRESIKRLDVGPSTRGGSYRGGILAEALPNLCELVCGGVEENSSPNTLLTSLWVSDVTPGSQGGLLSFAPNLLSLHIDAFWCTPNPLHRPWDSMLEAPTLPNLQRLYMPLITVHLMDEAFTAVTQRLSNLTCLELACVDGLQHIYDNVPDGGRARFAEGLAALPALTALKMLFFRSLGPFLGPALQALSGLTSLEMGEYAADSWEEDDGLVLEGCFPDFSAMPSLQHLALDGDQIIGSKELREMFSGGVASVKLLELRGMQYKQLQAACDMLNRVAALTSLQLCVHQPSARNTTRTKYDLPVSQALARHTQLQHLEIRAGLHSFVPWLASLPGLTKLTLVFDHTGVLEADLEVVGGQAGWPQEAGAGVIRQSDQTPVGRDASCQEAAAAGGAASAQGGAVD